MTGARKATPRKTTPRRRATDRPLTPRERRRIVLRRGLKTFAYTVAAIFTASGIGLVVYALTHDSGDQALILALTALLTPMFAMANKAIDTRAKASGIALPPIDTGDVQ